MVDNQIIGCLGDGVSVLVVAEDNPAQVEIKQVDPQTYLDINKYLIEAKSECLERMLPAA